MDKELRYFKFLILVNTVISLILTYNIILYNIEYINLKIIFILLYAFIWFFSLYKVYFLSKFGLKLYISLVILGILLSILSNLKIYGKIYYILSLLEHMIIGSIIVFSYFSKIKAKFK